MLLFVHDVVDQRDDDLREHLQNLLGLEVVGTISDDHRQCLFGKFEVSIGIVRLSEVQW